MEIPTYPASRPLTLQDKPLFDRLLHELQPRISELTFAGLYLFRKAHDYRLSAIGDSYVLLCKGYDGARYFLPPVGGDAKVALHAVLATGGALYCSNDGIAKELFDDNRLEIRELRDSFDYVYLREDLAILPGRKFHKKKNRINYFTTRHECVADLFSERHLDGCLALLDKWRQTSCSEDEGSVLMEIDAASEALHKAGELGLKGVVVTSNDALAAFALGERLNNDTAVCHFEKADPFMEGAYQLVNREFASQLFPESTFINREQDLGDMGLRSAKLSYHPVEMVKKFIVKNKFKDSIALSKKT